MIDPTMYTGGNGLISIRGDDNFAVVLTGTSFGNITVGLELLDQSLALDLSSWDEVVEVSMRFGTTRGGLNGTDAPGDPIRRLPKISSRGPGVYRIRVHARGRDLGQARGDNFGDPVEEFLLQAWPSRELESEERHKLTDRYGLAVRNRQSA